MKTAVSVPDDVFRRADTLARKTGRTRSDIYASALREYVARHATDEITEALDQVAEQLGNEAKSDRFMTSAARRMLGRSDW